MQADMGKQMNQQTGRGKHRLKYAGSDELMRLRCKQKKDRETKRGSGK